MGVGFVSVMLVAPSPGMGQRLALSSDLELLRRPWTEVDLRHQTELPCIPGGWWSPLPLAERRGREEEWWAWNHGTAFRSVGRDLKRSIARFRKRCKGQLWAATRAAGLV